MNVLLLMGRVILWVLMGILWFFGAIMAGVIGTGRN